MDSVIKQYTDLGVRFDKIVVAGQPNFIWSIPQKDFHDSKKPILKETPNGWMVDDSGNRFVTLMAYKTSLIDIEDIKKINESEGIIVLNYEREGSLRGEYLRFAYIPVK